MTWRHGEIYIIHLNVIRLKKKNKLIFLYTTRLPTEVLSDEFAVYTYNAVEDFERTYIFKYMTVAIFN